MDNYYDTSRRMFNSSKTLHDNGDFHNACYLAGYIIECYAKIVIGLSYGFSHSDLGGIFKHDLKKMDREFNYILTHSSLSPYMVSMTTDFPTILSGEKWNPMKRYSEQSDQWLEPTSINYQNEVNIAMSKIAQMQLNGYTLI
jgi:hypothetical protein